MRNGLIFFFLFHLGAISISLTAGGCKREEGSTGSVPGPVPITDNLFPLVGGRTFEYAGYATDADSGYIIQDPTGRYRTVWTILPNIVPSPLGGTARGIQDSTTGPFVSPGAYDVHTQLMRKDTVTGDFQFLQRVGPFKRRFGIVTSIPPVASDTLMWVHVARPSYGVGSTGAAWMGYDSTFDASGTPVRLQIFGMIEATESIIDSAAPQNTWNAYRSRLWRRVTVGGVVDQDNVTMLQVWLVKDLGPVQMFIAEDGENVGHFRVLKNKNF